ncbi:hypothetical protein AXK57_17950 [Tsukamurella pulmonis]|nr:hypothetical protein AXK56_22860 [Tsukamurella pulmonis]KXO88800.1 hypothetical protein AXK58_26220 [Tsukamurella tyrosinosolvens]KXP01934.1 hypothetical protein AXK59_20845 [Tsukamurella tyrosinosolvens]KXP08333.1 hypothetical protein AXK57_17950 [Tsukamurella pulmonis]KZL95195.1 hypothetical protein AXX05_11400 [Tsukamurella tyrosinosolvens]
MSGWLREGGRAARACECVQWDALKIFAIVVGDVRDALRLVVADYHDVVAAHAQLDPQIGEFCDLRPDQCRAALIDLATKVLPTLGRVVGGKHLDGAAQTAGEVHLKIRSSSDQVHGWHQRA